MDSKRLTAFRDELHKIQAKSNGNEDPAISLDDLVTTHVGLSLFNQTSALGQLTPTWTVDAVLKSEEHKNAYSTLLANQWELASQKLEDLFVGRLCYRLVSEDGALTCGTSDITESKYRQWTDDTSSLLFFIADEAHKRLRAMGMSGVGRCAAVRYPLCAKLPGPLPQRVRGECHAVFWHGNHVTLVDFHCRRLALPATSDLFRLSLYKALGLRIGLTTPDHLRVATLIAYLDQEKPRLRFWTYTLSKQMDEAVMSLDCLSQVNKLLQLHVTEVIT